MVREGCLKLKNKKRGSRENYPLKHHRRLKPMKFTEGLLSTLLVISHIHRGRKIEMDRLPIRLSINYQVKQVKHGVAKKHRRKRTYNNPNIHIKIFYTIYISCQSFISPYICQYYEYGKYNYDKYVYWDAEQGLPKCADCIIIQIHKLTNKTFKKN